MVYFDKYRYEKIDFENVAFFLLLIVYTPILLNECGVYVTSRPNYECKNEEVNHCFELYLCIY